MYKINQFTVNKNLKKRVKKKENNLFLFKTIDTKMKIGTECYINNPKTYLL